MVVPGGKKKKGLQGEFLCLLHIESWITVFYYLKKPKKKTLTLSLSLSLPTRLRTPQWRLLQRGPPSRAPSSLSRARPLLWKQLCARRKILCERAREKRARERDLAVANTLGTRQEHIRNPLGTETLLLRWPSARVGSRLSNRQRSSPGMFVIQNGTCQKKKRG